MKHVVGISLGSSSRNHTAMVNLMGEECKVERIATNGDLKAMISYVRENDGKVDAFGLGGIDRYLYAVNRRYEIRDAHKVAKVAQKTPVVDGSGLKNTLERKVIQYLREHTELLNNNPKALLMSAMDRIGMAQSLEDAGCKMVYGDFLYALKMPIPLYSLQSVAIAARILVPFIRLLPFKMIYPTGEQQNISKPRYVEYFHNADIIAGDFHFIRKYMPPELPGKTIITNTVTQEDLVFLQNKKIKNLVTTTPELDGRSFGTNVIEALLVCLHGSHRELTFAEYDRMLDLLNFEPRIIQFN